MNVVVTLPTDDQRFPLTGCHDLYPEGPFRSSFRRQVFERPDVMYLNVLLGATQFACVSQEPAFEFRAWNTDLPRRVI